MSEDTLMMTMEQRAEGLLDLRGLNGLFDSMSGTERAKFRADVLTALSNAYEDGATAQMERLRDDPPACVALEAESRQRAARRE